MKVRIKKLNPAARMPTRGTAGAGGYDLYSTKSMILYQDQPAKIPTGIAAEIPEGYAGFIITRSSVALGGVHVSMTLIDCDYRGEIFVTATKCAGDSDHANIYAGDRVAQLYVIPLPSLEFEWADELSETARGAGGYGSTGR